MNGAVICGVDDSAAAIDAASVGRELAERLELPLHLIHVAREAGADGPMQAVLERLAGPAAWSIEHGHPADRLVELAREQKAALVVLGCHGPRSSLLGSISADVSRRAPCPVVVVPPGAGMEGGATQKAAGFAGGIVRFDLI
jgi:nucleotide-binding universal stress UspA family protein